MEVGSNDEHNRNSTYFLVKYVWRCDGLTNVIVEESVLKIKNIAYVIDDKRRYTPSHGTGEVQWINQKMYTSHYSFQLPQFCFRLVLSFLRFIFALLLFPFLFHPSTNVYWSSRRSKLYFIKYKSKRSIFIQAIV